MSPVPLERPGPVVQRLNPGCIRSVQHVPSLASHLHQAHVAKHAQVLRHGWLGHLQQSNELTDRALLGGKKLEDRPSLRLRDRVEYVGARRSTWHVRHYIPIWECVNDRFQTLASGG